MISTIEDYPRSVKFATCYPNFQALVIATILAETSEESSLTEEQKTEFRNCWALINGDGHNKRVRRRLQLENQCIINDIKEYVSVWLPLIIMNFVNKMFWDVITNLGIFWQKVKDNLIKSHDM